MSRSYEITLNATQVKVSNKRNVAEEPSGNNNGRTKKKLQRKSYREKEDESRS